MQEADMRYRGQEIVTNLQVHRKMTPPDAQHVACALLQITWVAQYNTWLLIKLTLQGAVFYFIFFFAADPLPGAHEQGSAAGGQVCSHRPAVHGRGAHC